MGRKKSLLEQAEVGRPGEDETSLRYMLRLAAPMIVTTVSFTVMQLVDRLMVSRLGTEALAAIDFPLVRGPGGGALGARGKSDPEGQQHPPPGSEPLEIRLHDAQVITGNRTVQDDR